MKTYAVSERSRVQQRLVCRHCGNASRFFEVMAEEVHLVDGDRNYIRLFEAFVDRYVCCECSATIEIEETREK